MQQFQIPQFIEMEDKLFGPLTFKQFMYLVGGGGICFILYVWLPLPFIIKIIPIAGVAALALALAFVKYNGRPLYLEKRRKKSPEKSHALVSFNQPKYRPKTAKAVREQVKRIGLEFRR